MQSTTRMTSALALWVISMAIFILSSPFHVRAVRAFNIQSQSISSRHSTVAGNKFSNGPLFVTSSDALRRYANEITAQALHLEESNSSPIMQVGEPSVNVNESRKRALQERKRDWVERSVQYYSTIMRNDSRQTKGQLSLNDESPDSHKKNFILAKKLYFARHKIKSGQLNHAETIYRKLIDELVMERETNEECDHAQLATSTLLLALLLQRKKHVKETRAVFIRFFKIIFRDEKLGLECACCAKVLQAFALFEMKQGHEKKSYRLAQMAVKMDSDLEPLLNWKQFRDAKTLVKSSWVV